MDSFAEDAVIVDVSRQIRGQDAIRTWADNEVIGGKLQVIKADPTPRGVKALVQWAPSGTGGFRANYTFEIADDRIARADLQYA